MKKTGSMPFEPGTIFLFIIIALVGMGMYSWANASLGETKKSSLEDQDNAIECSDFSIEKVKLDHDDDHAEIFFQVNKGVDNVYVNFEGDQNISRTVTGLESGDMGHAGANISDFSEVSLKAGECNHVFAFE